MARLDVPVTDDQAAAVRFAADSLGQSVSEYVRRRVVVGAEPPPYRFSAGTIRDPSFVRDLAMVQGWKEGQSREVDEANERLRRFARWSEDNPIMFAPQTTTSASQIFPTGYRTAITIPMTADRPLASSTEMLPINGSNPFTVPRHTSGGTVAPPGPRPLSPPRSIWSSAPPR